MDDDQQFCLRWNNHQSTLVAVFDTLLENGTLVDCTLAAEGKYLNAHKVVLSACSPYFETLLSKHFDKHPIVVLKDVKFQELKAMMDYMYRGEVNISQDQLGALLKAAESLQIKGLSDNKRGETERKPVLPPKSPPTAAQPAPAAALPKVQGLTIEQRAGRDEGREGSASPGPRKKKRMRRKSEEMDNHHDASSSSESHSLPAAHTTVPALLPAISKMSADVPEPVETKSEILTRHKQPTLPDDHNSTPQTQQLPMLKEKIETHTELMLEPKAEYVEEMNEDSIEDLTLDDDDLSNMEQMDEQAGPSHGNAGEGSSQGFGGWHMGNQSQDEVFLAAQEAVGAHRDSQGNVWTEKPSIFQNGLEELLKQSPDGCFVLNNKHKLDNNCRQKLVKLIIDYLFQDQYKHKFPGILLEAAEEIVRLFPSERSTSYFIPYSQQPKLPNQRKSPARGKLYSRYANMKRALTLSMAGNNEQQGKVSLPQSHIISEKEKASYLTVQQSGNSYDDTLMNWKLSFRVRQAKLKTFETPLAYFNAFPALRQPFGYHLLTNDFGMKFPHAKDISLHKIWPKIGAIIIDLLKKRQNQLPDLACLPLDMHVQSVKLFPYLFTPAQVRLNSMKRMVRMSKSDMCDRFLLQVTDFSLLDMKIAERKEQLKETSTTIQPFMVAVGPLTRIEAYFVVLDYQKYLVNDCISAMDAAFKMFHALDLPYPIETKNMWQTIDHLVYKVSNYLDPSASVVIGEIEHELNTKKS